MYSIKVFNRPTFLPLTDLKNLHDRFHGRSMNFFDRTLIVSERFYLKTALKPSERVRNGGQSGSLAFQVRPQ